MCVFLDSSNIPHKTRKKQEKNKKKTIKKQEKKQEKTLNSNIFCYNKNVIVYYLNEI